MILRKSVHVFNNIFLNINIHEKRGVMSEITLGITLVPINDIDHETH